MRFSKICALIIATTSLLAGCSSLPKEPDAVQIAVDNEKFKREVPETIIYTLQGLDVEKCGEKYCLTKESMERVQHDRKTLLGMFDAKQKEVQAMTQAYNNMVDANTSLQTSAAYTEARAARLEYVLDKERTRNTLEKWGERLLFFGGVAIFGLLP